MNGHPTLIFVPGSWHKPACYAKVIEPLQSQYGARCLGVSLPTTNGDRHATFKDDLDAARAAIHNAVVNGEDVILIAHSYGGIVGSSAVKGFTAAGSQRQGCVKALILIASGFNITGMAFMDPLFGIPPPSWRKNERSGFAELATPPRELFYHDVPEPDASDAMVQLAPQSLKALFEGGEHTYSGWRDVPTWYIGTTEDRALPIVVQRVQVGFARAQGGVVHHVELQSSHSPFLSMPEKVVEIVVQAVRAVQKNDEPAAASEMAILKRKGFSLPCVRLREPATYFRYGVPFAIGRILGWALMTFGFCRSIWRSLLSGSRRGPM